MQRQYILNDPTIANWIAKHADTAVYPESQSIGILDNNNNILAGVLYRPSSIREVIVSIASDGTKRWMTRQFLFEIFAFGFLHLDKRRGTVLIKSNNVESIRLVKHLGFTHEGTIRKAVSDDVDLLLFGMLREDCKWIQQDFINRLPRQTS